MVRKSENLVQSSLRSSEIYLLSNDPNKQSFKIPKTKTYYLLERPYLTWWRGKFIRGLK